MAQSKSKSEFTQSIAKWILIVAFVSITVIAIVVILRSPDDAMTVLNTLLPVYGTWIGTVIAFYFGAKNFQTASEQSRALYKETQKVEGQSLLINQVMRKLADMTVFVLKEGITDEGITIQELKDKYGENVTRLPVLNADTSPKYMIHKSKLDAFISGGGTYEATLADFFAKQQVEFGVDQGFVVVAESENVANAKSKLEENSTVQDIFVTKNGSSKEPLLGWVSNIRLTKALNQ